MNRLLQITNLLLASFFALLASSCTASKETYVSPYFIKNPLYTDVAYIQEANTNYKTMAVLPVTIKVNTRYPSGERVDLQTELVKEHPKEWMRFYYVLFSRHADELNMRVQPPDTTLALLSRAGIVHDSLSYVSRQRLMDILGVDALLMQDFDINIYSTKGQDVAAATGALLLFAAGSAGGLPSPYGSSRGSRSNSVHFMKVYDKGVETPIWSVYGPQEYDTKQPPTIPNKSSLDHFRYLKFPFLKEYKLRKVRPIKTSEKEIHRASG